MRARSCCIKERRSPDHRRRFRNRRSLKFRARSTSKLRIDQPKLLMTRSRAVAFQLFRTKSADHLIAEAAAPERQMKRALGPFALTCIGIGAIIGTGIFALAGTAAAGEQAQVGGSGYFVRLCGSRFGLKFPLWLVNDHTTSAGIVAQGGDALANYSSTTLPTIAGHAIALNLPALLIVAAVTALLIYGIRESARTNTTIVIIKVAVVVFVISFGAFLVHPTNWHPFLPTGIGGVMSGAAIVFFAFIGFDAVSTTAEETKNPQRDMPIGIIASLIICTVLYVLMAGVITGMRNYTNYLGDPAAVATAFAGYPWAQALISAGAIAGITSVLLVFQLGQPRIFMAMARDGLLPQYFSKIHPKFRTPHITTIWTGVFVGGIAAVVDIGSLADLTNIGTLFAFILVCLGVIVLRRTQPSRPRPFRVPFVPLFPILGVIFCFVLMLSLPLDSCGRFVGWLVIGHIIYGCYGFWRSKLRNGIDTGITEDQPPPLIKP